MGVMDRDRCIKVSGLLGSTISMGEDLPVRFFCALSKRAQRYYLKLYIKGQHPNNKFRRLLCAFIWGSTQGAGRSSQVAGRSSQLRYTVQEPGSQVAGHSSQLAARMSEPKFHSIWYVSNYYCVLTPGISMLPWLLHDIYIVLKQRSMHQMCWMYSKSSFN